MSWDRKQVGLTLAPTLLATLLYCPHFERESWANSLAELEKGMLLSILPLSYSLARRET